MQQQIYIDGTMRCFLVETMRPQNIFQPQQLHVGSKGHLSRAIGVKIELVLDNLGEMLQKRLVQ